MIASQLAHLETLDFVIYTFIALAIYLIATCLYRIFFHPLSKYPGPISYKLSGWPLLYQAYRGDRHIWHLKDHENYGKHCPKLLLTSNQPS
ncbi:hypothetical protein NX059_010723 [Plenodomus lindquistii]|nr:hypothetical protein NX059_010723 [Plenodomus lindquistii]